MTTREALLVLEDGTAFRGRSFGRTGEAFGEAVFNTAMSGYQEVLTDPSYSGQIVAMTYPHQGNYGTNGDDAESDRIQVAGFVVREASRRPSSWRAEKDLHGLLEEEGIVGIEGIDTRKLTLRVREGGAMRCGVSTEDLDAASLADRVREQPGMEGADLARHVSAGEAYEAADVVGPASTAHGRVFRVAAYDFGMKRNILRLLAAAGCEGMVFPAETPAETILADGFDGVFLSNGPGDPAATRYGVQACKDLLGRIPIFGICLGHQLLGLALGAKTYKLKFGHRGANQPVLDVDTGRVEVTSHNHGFAVDPKSFGDGGLAAAVSTAGSPPSADGSPPPSSAAAQNRPIAETEISRVALTHWNLNDNTLEGLRCLEVPAFSVQYHPEAAPGPHDARYLFGRFRELMSHA